MLLFTYVRLAHGFSDYKTRLKSVQVTLIPSHILLSGAKLKLTFHRRDFKLSQC